MDGKAKWSMFRYGALGGVLPTLATLASTYVANPSEPLPAIGLYFGLAIWAIVGGSVALTNSTPEMRQAIFAGMAAPAIVMNVISGAAEARMQRIGWISQALAVAGVSTAIAAEMPSATAQMDAMVTGKGSTLVVSPQVTGGQPVRVNIPVTAEVNRNGKTESVPIGSIKELKGTSYFELPENSSKVFVHGIGVPVVGPVTGVNLDVTTGPTMQSDFWWALGAPRTFAIEGVGVEPKK